MEAGVVEKQTSYTYWVREARDDAAPLPVPRKISEDDLNKQPNPNTLGSVWNRAGTWEEKNLNSWASCRIKELITSIDVINFTCGSAAITQVTKCSGDAFVVTVRNKKRVGYTFELTLEFKGEWLIHQEKKKVKGHIDIPEFSFGELDELQICARISENDSVEEEKARIFKDLNMFLKLLRGKLLEFEEELKQR